MHSIHLVLGMATYRNYIYEIWWVVIPDSKGRAGANFGLDTYTNP